MLRAAVLLILLAAPAGAAEIWSGTPVTILRTDGSAETAKYHSTRLDPPRLLVIDTSARDLGVGVTTRAIPLAEVASIEGPSGTTFRTKTVLLSTLVGAVAGAVVGILASPTKSVAVVMPAFGPVPPSETESAVGIGIAAGAIGGAAVGALLAPTAGPVRKWTFNSAGEPVQVTDR